MHIAVLTTEQVGENSAEEIKAAVARIRSEENDKPDGFYFIRHGATLRRVLNPPTSGKHQSPLTVTVNVRGKLKR
jgi:hypothetical protein